MLSWGDEDMDDVGDMGSEDWDEESSVDDDVYCQSCERLRAI